MIKNLMYRSFLLVVINFSFSLMAMYFSDDTIITLHCEKPTQMISIDDLIKNKLEKNQWFLLNKTTNRGIVVGIDLLTICDDIKETSNIDLKNSDFEQSLQKRLHNAAVRRFSKQDVKTKIIPCDLSDESIVTLVNILRFAKESRLFEQSFSPGAKYVKDTSVISYEILDADIKKLSLDELVKGINLFSDLGVCSRYAVLGRREESVNHLLICAVGSIVRQDIGDLFNMVNELLWSEDLQCSEQISKKLDGIRQRLIDYEALDKVFRFDLIGLMQYYSIDCFKIIAKQLEEQEKELIQLSQNMVANINVYREEYKFGKLINEIHNYVILVICKRDQREGNKPFNKITPVVPSPKPNDSKTYPAISQNRTHWWLAAALLLAGVGGSFYLVYNYLMPQK